MYSTLCGQWNLMVWDLVSFSALSVPASGDAKLFGRGAKGGTNIISL